MSDEGRKDDEGKFPYHLLPTDAERGVARVLALGAKKYGERNWERGMAWSRCYAALQRHMTEWWEGRSVDDETGLSHLDHAACCVMFLSAYEKRAIGTDDRPHHLANAMREDRANEAAVAAMRALIGQTSASALVVVDHTADRSPADHPAQGEDELPDLFDAPPDGVKVAQDIKTVTPPASWRTLGAPKP